MPRQFQRRIENFVCANCGAEVIGNGYTNHCPNCLWSRHVDIHPGDRAETCAGMMAPVAVTRKGQHYAILHRCQTCGTVRPCKADPADNFEVLLEIAALGPYPKY